MNHEHRPGRTDPTQPGAVAESAGGQAHRCPDEQEEVKVKQASHGFVTVHVEMARGNMHPADSDSHFNAW